MTDPSALRTRSLEFPSIWKKVPHHPPRRRVYLYRICQVVAPPAASHSPTGQIRYIGHVVVDMLVSLEGGWG